jgi:hypothetical protein
MKTRSPLWKIAWRCTFELIQNSWEIERMFCTKKLRHLHSFPTVYHLHHLDKRFKSNDQTTVRNKELLYSDQKFTNTFQEVHSCIWGSSTNLFFLGGNHTHRNRPYEVRLPKSIATTCNWQQCMSHFTSTWRDSPARHSTMPISNRRRTGDQIPLLIFLKLVLNNIKFEKIFYIKNLCLINIIGMLYQLHYFDKWFENNTQKKYAKPRSSENRITYIQNCS